MSGLEVVGAAASVAQLTQYILGISGSIYELIHKLRNAPSVFKRHADTINQVITVVEVIRANEWLHTPAIASLLERIWTVAMEALNLLPTLKRDAVSAFSINEYWKAFRGLRKENEILDRLKTLGELKSVLVVRILDIQTTHAGQSSCNIAKLLQIIPKLDAIQQHVSSLQLPVQLGTPPASDYPAENNAFHLSKPSKATSVVEPSRGSCSLETTLEAQHLKMPFNKDSVETPIDTVTGRSPLRNSFGDSEHRRVPTEASGKSYDTRQNAFPEGCDLRMVEEKTAHVGKVFTYEQAASSGTACQINGSIFTKPLENSNCHYVSCSASDYSFQINGNIDIDAMKFVTPLFQRN